MSLKRLLRVQIINKRVSLHYTETDLELYIESTMKQEKIKPQTFCIAGKNIFIKELHSELIEIGFIKNTTYPEIEWDHTYLGNNTMITSMKSLKDYCNIIGSSFDPTKRDKTFNLPSQYSEALQFCKEQKGIAENYFKKEEEFKAGDWVKFDVEKARGTKNFTPCWNESHILQIIEIPEGRSIYCSVDFPLINGYKTLGKTISNNKNNFIKATDEEIKKELERREKLKFPQITIGGYKGVFEKDVVKFGCNHIPKEIFISFYEAIKQLPKNNFFNSMKLNYQDHEFEVTFNQIKEIADYYLNK